mmetsp:Transcript_8760/g.27945  ORF Transcript_8760/g.27945 Transcript_8760/m.27945 type:complete len:287 (-) Transcript_8760:230-1090(-)
MIQIHRRALHRSRSYASKMIRTVTNSAADTVPAPQNVVVPLPRTITTLSTLTLRVHVRGARAWWLASGFARRATSAVCPTRPQRLAKRARPASIRPTTSAFPVRVLPLVMCTLSVSTGRTTTWTDATTPGTPSSSTRPSRSTCTSSTFPSSSPGPSAPSSARCLWSLRVAPTRWPLTWTRTSPRRCCPRPRSCRPPTLTTPCCVSASAALSSGRRRLASSFVSVATRLWRRATSSTTRLARLTASSSTLTCVPPVPPRASAASSVTPGPSAPVRMHPCETTSVPSS